MTVRAEVPEVVAEPAVEPAYRPDRESRRFCVPPNELAEYIEEQIPEPPEPPTHSRDYYVALAEGEQSRPCAAVETAYTIHVKELLYPGTPKDIADANGRWLYVFREGKLAVEATCVEGETWDGWKVNGSARTAWRSVHGVRLDPGPKGQRYKYSFFLSPVQLTREGIEDIEKGTTALSAVECACNRYEKTVYVPDPLRWACDVHDRYYRPLVNALYEWRYDENLTAYEFIALVLKAWIDNGDKAHVKNHLRRQPDDWLNARALGVKRAQELADEAGAYLAHCVDSAEFIAVEKACRIRGNQELELIAVCLATVTRALSATEPGRLLAKRLLLDPDRLPHFLTFQDDGPRLPDEWFGRYRYGQKGLLAVFQDLFPTWVQLSSSGPQAAAAIEKMKAEAALEARYGKISNSSVLASVALKERARKYLANVGARVELWGSEAALLDNLERNRPVTAGARKNSEQWKRLLVHWQKLAQIDEVKRAVPTKAEERLEKLEGWAKRYEPFEAFAKRLSATVGTAVEIANLALALDELGKASDAERAKKQGSVISAVMDLVAHGSGFAHLFMREAMSEVGKKEVESWLRAAKFAGGVAGVIGGVIDTLDYIDQAKQAREEYDYGKFVGRSMQTAGAAMSVVGSSMVVVAVASELAGEGAAAGAAAGPAGALIGLVGGLLVASGFVVAKWLELNANEVFASRCFLGKHWARKDQPVSWSEVRLPTRDPAEEEKVLVDLISNFEVSSFSGINDWSVLVRPGYLDDRSTFELVIERHARNDEPHFYEIVIDVSRGDIVQTAGLPLKGGFIKRDAEDRIESIEIDVEEVTSRATGPGWQNPTVVVFLRLLRASRDGTLKQQIPGNKLLAVKYEVTSSGRVSSLQQATWVSLPEVKKEVR